MTIWSRLSSIIWGEWGSTSRREECWLKVGQQVVCVANDADGGRWMCVETRLAAPWRPRFRDIYTITKIRKDSGRFFLGFAEAPSHMIVDARWFRPVRPTSIECFRALLTAKPSDLPAEPADTPAPALIGEG